MKSQGIVYRYLLFSLLLSPYPLFLSPSSFSQSWSRCSAGLPQDTAVFSLAKIGNTLFAGTQHAGVYKSTDEGLTWITTNLHDPVRNATIRSMTAIDTFLFAGQSANGVARTTLNGSTWTTINNGILFGNGIQSIFDIITIGQTLYAACIGGGVFVSSDKGDHWTNLYDNQGLNDVIVLSLAANNDFLFAGTAGTNYTMPDTGVCFVTPLVNGTAWSLINNGLIRNGAHLEEVFAMAANDSLVFAGTDDVGIHRSTDNGQTWKRMPDTNLNGDIWAIAIVGNQVFYGTLYHGIFTSDDTGLTYHENNAGLNYNGISIPDVINDFVVFEPYIYAATTTGVYKQLLPQASAIPVVPALSGGTSVSVFPNPFSGQTSMTIFSELEKGQVHIAITDLFGREVRKISKVLNGNQAKIVLDLQDLPAGTYFYYVQQGNHFIQSGKLVVK